MPRSRKRPSKGERRHARLQRIFRADPLLDDLRLEYLGKELTLVNGLKVMLAFTGEHYVLTFNDGSGSKIPDVILSTGGWPWPSVSQLPWPGEQLVRKLVGYDQPKESSRSHKKPAWRRSNNISCALQH